MSTMIILIVVFAILMAGVLYCEHDNPKFLWSFSVLWAIAFMIAVLVFSGMKPLATIPETEVEPNIYFVYAEKTADNDGLITFVTINTKEQTYLSWDNIYGYDYPDVPYILSIDSKGTASLSDDEIVAVWANN